MEKKLNIGIIVASLGVGGAERSSAILSEMLTELGYNVTIISEFDRIDYKYKGKFIALDNQEKGVWDKVARLLILRKIIKKGNYDYIVETRSRKNWLKQIVMNLFVLNRIRSIFMIHNYNFKKYFPDSVMLTRLLYKNVYQLVGVSEAIVGRFKEVYGIDNCRCIYNAFDKEYYESLGDSTVSLEQKPFILSYGRIEDDSKDYTFLLKSYAQSSLAKQGVNLMILGDGPDKDKIVRLSEELKINEYVFFKDFTSNPFPYVKKAMLTTLTSNYEGFPMILVESLAMGTPVVSVDCASGPSEIIRTGVNGILVAEKTISNFAAALDKMITEKDFYYTCKEGTKPSVEKYRKEFISQDWKKILVHY